MTIFFSKITTILGLSAVILGTLGLGFSGVKSEAQTTNNTTSITDSTKMPINNNDDGYSVPKELNTSKGDVKLQGDINLQNTGRVLSVPYFNQRLNSGGKNEYPRSGNWMCSAASSVMISGYFDSLNYDKNNTWSLKKYMFSNSGQGISSLCRDNTELVKAFGEKGLGGAFAVTSVNDKGIITCHGGYKNGIKQYFSSRGLIADDIGFDFASIKKSIDQNRPILASITSPRSHIFVIKGYINDGKVIVNDPWTNMQNGTSLDSPSNRGKDAVYDINKLGRNYLMSIRSSNPAPVPIDNVAIVKQIYRDLLKREADTGGLNYYVNNMINGWTKDNVINDIKNSAEYKKLNPGVTPAPSGSVARIKAYNNKNFCLDLNGNNQSQNARINLSNAGNCSGNNAAQQFLLPNGMTTSTNSGQGQIRLAANPAYCLDFDGERTNPKASMNTLLSKCNNGAYSSTEWKFYSNGTIRPVANTNFCLSNYSNRLVNLNQTGIWNCNGNGSSDQMFYWE
jgi:Peptidase_C39 like family/Ricin-type beta-trefoil lectin domain/Domain of unknown function (DUF4214)